MRLATLVLALAVVASGCTSPERDPDDTTTPPGAPASRAVAGGSATFLAPSTTLSGCPALRGVDCFEPTVAAAAGRLFSSAGGGDSFAASDDGGKSWSRIPMPPLPPLLLVPTRTGDNSLQVDPEGRLWVSRLVYPDSPPNQNIAGFQVSRSDDGGLSWPVSHFFGLYDVTPDPILAGDRQWLSFGPGGKVVAQYWNFLTSQHQMAVSRDGGESFGPFVDTPALLTAPGVVATDGSLHLFYFEVGTPYRVLHAATSDDGATWSTETVADGPPGAGNGAFQVFATVDGTGRFHAIWIQDDGAVLLSSGTSGAWSEPVRWNGNATAVAASPMVLAHDGFVDAFWYDETADGQRPVFAWAPEGTAQEGPAQTVFFETLPSADKSTDFAWLATTPDGRALVTWTHHELGVRVVVEAPRAA